MYFRSVINLTVNVTGNVYVIETGQKDGTESGTGPDSQRGGRARQPSNRGSRPTGGPTTGRGSIPKTSSGGTNRGGFSAGRGHGRGINRGVRNPGNRRGPAVAPPASAAAYPATNAVIVWPGAGHGRIPDARDRKPGKKEDSSRTSCTKSGNGPGAENALSIEQGRGLTTRPRESAQKQRGVGRDASPCSLSSERSFRRFIFNCVMPEM